MPKKPLAQKHRTYKLLTVNLKKGNRKRKNRATLKPSQGEAARILRVSREYLNRCINGTEKNPTLLACYNDLIAPKTPTPPTP